MKLLKKFCNFLFFVFLMNNMFCFRNDGGVKDFNFSEEKCSSFEKKNKIKIVKEILNLSKIKNQVYLLFFIGNHIYFKLDDLRSTNVKELIIYNENVNMTFYCNLNNEGHNYMYFIKYGKIQKVIYWNSIKRFITEYTNWIRKLKEKTGIW
jgi:hypothetical protein